MAIALITGIAAAAQRRRSHGDQQPQPVKTTASGFRRCIPNAGKNGGVDHRITACAGDVTLIVCRDGVAGGIFAGGGAGVACHSSVANGNVIAVRRINSRLLPAHIGKSQGAAIFIHGFGYKGHIGVGEVWIGALRRHRAAAGPVPRSLHLNGSVVKGQDTLITEDIEEGERIKSLEKSTQLSEKAKMRKSALLYLIETNLYLVNERKEEAIDSSKLSELLSFAKWIIYLQNSSDLCFHTDSDTKLIVEDDYRIDVELGENYSQTFEKESQRRIIAEPFNLRGDNTDRDFFEKVANAFYEDLGVHFKVLESVLHHLSDSSFSHDNVEFDEIAPNVIKAKATDVLNDYLSFVVENVPVEDVKSAYDFLTIVPGQLKTICDTTHPILPIWEREKRNHCFAVRPIYMSNNDYIYSPIIMEEVRKRWIEGFLQFYPPFEIGLERTCTALYAWKNNYEHLFSSEVEVLLKESGCEYAKHDVDLRREDRRGNHPTIDVLGDYDVIGLNTTQKRIFIIECKVLQPIGSVFEHSNQQKRFFTKEKFDEKFQKRIDYFSKVAMSFFANHGYDTEGFTINPYMVVNKVFSSYYKHVQFPIVTFDELKREIQL